MQPRFARNDDPDMDDAGNQVFIKEVEQQVPDVEDLNLEVTHTAYVTETVVHTVEPTAYEVLRFTSAEGNPGCLPKLLLSANEIEEC